MRVEELKQRDEAMASLPGMDSTHIDDLLLSLMDPPPSPRPPSVASSVETKAGGSPPAKSCTAKRGQAQAFDEDGFQLDERGLPLATDDESRRARKMARNRRAAADSRARKKERTDELEARVAALEAENQQLRSRLARAEGLPSGDGEENREKQEDHTDPRWPISPQPEVECPAAVDGDDLPLAPPRLALGALSAPDVPAAMPADWWLSALSPEGVF